MMNLLLAVLAVAVVPMITFAAVPKKILDSDYADLWKAWKSKYNKEYDTIAEEAKRFDIWVQAKKEVSEHNIKHELGLSTYTQALNEFSDMSAEEFRSIYLGHKRMLRSEHYAAEPFPAQGSVPDTVDWVSAGYVTGVKNQASCGSCWAFSATGSVEGLFYNTTKNLQSFSEQQLVSCDSYCGGCGGGWAEAGITYFAKNGVYPESVYPYTSGNGYVAPCQSPGTPLTGVVSGYKSLPSGDENSLKDASATIGPISIAIDASQTSFQRYSGGVYYEPYCSTRSLDHAVLLVGYGTDSASNEAYWLVKNSWGTSWGMNGYIMMIRNYGNNCGVATEASYAYL